MIRRKDNEILVCDISTRELAEEYGTPLYVYDIESIRANVRIIKDAISYHPLSLHFACMANNNIALLNKLSALQIGVFVCTPGELIIAQNAGFQPNQIVMTGCNLSDLEIRQMASSGATLVVNSMEQLVELAKCKDVRILGLRICPDISVPSETINPSVGLRSRLGLQENEVWKAVRVAEKMDVLINGVHMYLGTNILDHAYFTEAVDRLLYFAEKLENLEYVDIGGGFGIPYKQEDHSFDWGEFGERLTNRMTKLSKTLNKNVELKLEPGRAIVGTAGILLTRVIEVKSQNGFTFVGTDTSLSNFARPYIYNQYHEILLAANFENRSFEHNVFIGGNTVASHDFLAKDIVFPTVKKGDLLAIMSTGAYGFSMSSHFCCRLRPAEVLVRDKNVSLVREREKVDCLIQGQLPVPEQVEVDCNSSQDMP